MAVDECKTTHDTLDINCIYKSLTWGYTTVCNLGLHNGGPNLGLHNGAHFGAENTFEFHHLEEVVAA